MTKVNKTRMDVLMRAVDRLEYAGNWIARIYLNEVSHYGKDEIKEYAISWASIGAVSADKTREFIQQLEKLTRLVDTINAMEIVEDWETEDKKITTREEYNRAVDAVMAYIEAGWSNAVQEFLEGGR